MGWKPVCGHLVKWVVYLKRSGYKCSSKTRPTTSAGDKWMCSLLVKWNELTEPHCILWDIYHLSQTQKLDSSLSNQYHTPTQAPTPSKTGKKKMNEGKWYHKLLVVLTTTEKSTKTTIVTYASRSLEPEAQHLNVISVVSGFTVAVMQLYQGSTMDLC